MGLLPVAGTDGRQHCRETGEATPAHLVCHIDQGGLADDIEPDPCARPEIGRGPSRRQRDPAGRG